MSDKEIEIQVDKQSLKSGIFGGLIASMCCISPLVIVMFSLGSVTFALAIATYKIWFIVAGALFSGTVILYQLQKRNSCNIKGIKRNKSLIITAFLTFAVVYSISIYGIVPVVAPLVFESGGVELDKESGELYEMTFTVGELNCASCESGIKWYLENQVDGVFSAEVTPSGAVKVIYDSETIDAEGIIESEVFDNYPPMEINENKRL
ncbi:MAG: heavy-metal-associated domain-containing protein [archaeon]|jgi:copper chaperone CopZ|nr:heavy-metal-associated domain-containing protein [archaeon]